MMDVTKSLPDDPAELRAFTALLLAEVKSQAVLITKLRHQLAGQRAHRFAPSSETSEQLQLALESAPWSAIGPRTMASEELEYVPGRFVVNRIVRPRMACSGCDCFTQAPLPSRPIERGRPGPGLLAHVLVNK
jgi:transposase